MSHLLLMLRHRLVRPLLTLAAVPLCACQGQLSVDLGVTTDSNTQRVVLAVPSVDLLNSSGTVVNVDTSDSDTFNLFNYSEGDYLQLISKDAVDNANYISIRPRIDDTDAYVLNADGDRVPLDVVSQPEYSTLSFTLADNASVSIVLEMDLRFSLIDRQSTLGTYQLAPVVRAVDADTAGSIEGTIADTTINDSDCRNGRSAGTGVAVYVYEGSDVTPVDYIDSGNVTAADPPIASATARYDSDSESWIYAVNYIAPGDYTVALTCQADEEDPTTDDGLTFSDATNVTVTELDTSTVNF